MVSDHVMAQYSGSKLAVAQNSSLTIGGVTLLRWLLSWALLIVVCSFTSSCNTGAAKSQEPRSSSRPDFHPAPEAPAMPKALMKLPRTDITSAKFPALDFHFHGSRLKTAEDYKALIKQMD